MTFEATQGIAQTFGRTFIALRRLVSRNKQPGHVFYVNSTPDGGVAQGLAVILASVLPVLPVIILFFVDSLPTRIGLILIFTAVFAAVLVFGFQLDAERVLTITTA
jgi:VIT1/CCC1 family predicted Fe2+/Mn2+ transporter